MSGWAAMAPTSRWPAPGSAAQFAAPPHAAPPLYAGGGVGHYHDSFILKFTPDGKYLGQIGKANGSKGSLDTDNVRGVAQIRFLPGNEMVLADGYGNKRISVWDAATLKFKRMWGAYGKKPDDTPIPHYDVNSPQFGNPVHCAQPSNDGLIYVCDRTNNRIQVFKIDGTFVKQYRRQAEHQGRRLGVGDRLLAAIRSRSSCTSPTAPTRTSMSSTARP